MAKLNGTPESVQNRETRNNQAHEGRKVYMRTPQKIRKFAPHTLIALIITLFAFAFSGTAFADARQDCIDACNGGDPSVLTDCVDLCPAAGGGKIGGSGGGTGGKTGGGAVTSRGCGDDEIKAPRGKCIPKCEEGESYIINGAGEFECAPCKGDACESATLQFVELKKEIKALRAEVAAIKPTCPEAKIIAPAWYAGMGFMPWLLVIALCVIILVLALRRGGPKPPTQEGQQPQQPQQPQQAKERQTGLR